MTRKGAERGTLRGVHVWSALLAFFALVIAVNATFISLAIGTFPGEDTRRSYLQGLHYNETLAERRAQTKLGWRASAEIKQSHAGAIIEVELRGANGAPLSGLSVSGTLRRPAEAHADVPLRFSPHGEGSYATEVRGLAAGQWRLQARAESGSGEAFNLERTFIWRTR